MKILVVNVGSTSYKCRLYDMETETEAAKGSIEKVGTAQAIVSYSKGKETLVDRKIIPVSDHKDAVKLINGYLLSDEIGVIKDLLDISAVGFKTIQAGEKNGSVLLTREVTEAMERYASLAPAHNPPYLKCIYYFREIMQCTPLVGVFEPGFHTEVPEYARVFGTPYEWYEKHHVQKYGYHGATFRYVTDHAVGKSGLPKESIKIIACHLGGSSSICAYKGGRSMDVSMTFTPQSGLLQTNRTGDIDPFILPYIMEQKKIPLEAALKELTSNGGLKGISGTSGDMRDIWKEADKGSSQAKLAIDKFVYDVVRYIGAYYVLLQGVDVIAFSGGIGLNDCRLREMIMDRIAFLGIELDPAESGNTAEGWKTKKSSKIKVLTVNTNEEIVVARETRKVVAFA